MLLLVSSSLLLKAQHQEIRKLKSHQGISVATNLDVLYVLSDRNEIVLDCANKEHIALINTDVKNGILQIQYEPNSRIRSSKKNKVVVYSNHKLNTLKVSSSGNLKVEAPVQANTVHINSSSSGKLYADKIKANTINVNLSSSGQLQASIASANLNIQASSSGKINLTGETSIANVNMSSSALLELSRLTIKDLVCKGSSSARLNMLTAQTIKSNLSSSSTVTYSKAPGTILENRASSNGKLMKKS